MRLVPGAAIGLLLLTTWPGIIGLAESGAEGYRFWLAAFSCAVSLVFARLLLGRALSIRRVLSLLRHGQRRRAVVTRCRRSRLRGETRLMQIDWTDEAGQTGESRSLAPQDLPKVGAAPHVFADPRGRLPPALEGEA